MNGTVAQARQLLCPMETGKSLGSWPPESLGLPTEQLLLCFSLKDRRLWDYLRGDLEPPSSLQPLATLHQRCLVPLQIWGFLLVLWEAPVMPVLGVCGEAEGRGEGDKARVVHCCLTLSPSPVKWLKNYLSHKSDEARVAWAFELTQGPLCSDLCQAPHSINGSQCLLTKYKDLNPLLASPSNICVLRNLWSFPSPFPQATLAPELLPCWHYWSWGFLFSPWASWFLVLCQLLPTVHDLSKPSLTLPASTLFGEQELNLLTELHLFIAGSDHSAPSDLCICPACLPSQ